MRAVSGQSGRIVVLLRAWGWDRMVAQTVTELWRGNKGGRGAGLLTPLKSVSLGRQPCSCLFSLVCHPFLAPQEVPAHSPEVILLPRASLWEVLQL